VVDGEKPAVDSKDEERQGTRREDDVHGGPKKWGHRLMTIILSNLNRF